MEKKLIVFAANEQSLKRISGECHYSSNKVAYVQAHFYLEDNWTGFGSVRAVWWSGFEKGGISTVLDSEGECLVPAEVLKRKGKVEVNLVGSIVEDNVLTDRLTTYPELALIVDANSKVTGTETAPLTPSQFEQFVSIVIDEVGKVTGMTAQAITLPAGSPATASYSDGVLTIGIPQGAQGETGNGIESVVLNADYTLTINFTDGTSTTTTSIRGESGNGIRSITKTGTSGLVDTYTITFTDGTTTTFTVTNGEKGDKGDKGDRGETGATGADGFSPIVTVTEISGGHEVSIEDAEQTQTFDVMDGVTPVIPWDSILPIDTASGDIASFPDGSELVPARSVKVELEPTQDLHGYDKPWSGGNGVNKWDEEWEVGDIDSTTGAPSSGNFVRTKNFTPVTEVEYYWCAPSGTHGRVYYYDADKNFLSFGFSSNAKFTPPTGARFIKFRMGTSYGTTYNHDIAINYPSTVTTYSPYSNECPIYGRTECVTERTGANVWDEEWELGTISTSTGQNGSNNTLIRSTNYIPCVPNTQYYPKAPSGTGGNLFFYDADKNYISYVGMAVNLAFTTPSNAHYMRFRMGSAYGTTYNHDISINYPSTDTDYHAYDGETYTTALGRTVYGGTLDVVSGVLTVDRAMVDLGTLNYSLRNNTSARQAWNALISGIKTLTSEDKVIGAISSAFVAVANNATWEAGNMSSGGANTEIMAFCVESNKYATAAEFQAAMSGVQLCYPLATPTTYQLTPTEIDLLHGQNNLWSDGEIEVEYNADIQLYIEKKLG